MRLVTFSPRERPAPPRLGIVLPDGGVLDAAEAWSGLHGAPAPTELTSMQALLDAGPDAIDRLRLLAERAAGDPTHVHTPAAVQLAAPLPRPRSIRDCMAFETHLLQATRGAAELLYPPVGRLDRLLARVFGRGFLGVPALFHEIPAYYKGNPASVVGPDAEIRWPAYTERLDYELELGILIGRSGRDIPERDARAYIAGYLIFNDFSARDAQLKEMKLRLGPAKGKDFDTGNAMGPWLVTPDEVPDPYHLHMVARVDGETWTDADSSGMSFSLEEIISYISRSETLYPGDFIGAGTVGGGCGLEHGRWLAPGQTVELEIEHLGVLRNHISHRGPTDGRP